MVKWTRVVEIACITIAAVGVALLLFIVKTSGFVTNDSGLTDASTSEAVAQSNSYLVTQVGVDLFKRDFKYESVESGDGSPPLYEVDYAVTLDGTAHQTFDEPVNVYLGTNVIDEIPQCASDPSKCVVNVSEADAQRIAHSIVPGFWTAQFRYDTNTDSYQWHLFEQSNSEAECYVVTINVTTGAIEERTSGACPGARSPPP